MKGLTILNLCLGALIGLTIRPLWLTLMLAVVSGSSVALLECYWTWRKELNEQGNH